MDCPMCNKFMRVNSYKDYICSCQGALLDLVELQKRATAQNAVSSSGSHSNGTHAQGITLAPSNHQSMTPQSIGPANTGLPSTEFYTIKIPMSSTNKDFFSRNKYYLDFKNSVWFKKVRATAYNLEKGLLSQAGIDHEVSEA